MISNRKRELFYGGRLLFFRINRLRENLFSRLRLILKNTTGNHVARAPERFALRAAAYTHSLACFLCLAEPRCLAAVPGIARWCPEA